MFQVATVVLLFQMSLLPLSPRAVPVTPLLRLDKRRPRPVDDQIPHP